MKNGKYHEASVWGISKKLKPMFEKYQKICVVKLRIKKRFKSITDQFTNDFFCDFF